MPAIVRDNWKYGAGGSSHLDATSRSAAWPVAATAFIRCCLVPVVFGGFCQPGTADPPPPSLSALFPVCLYRKKKGRNRDSRDDSATSRPHEQGNTQALPQLEIPRVTETAASPNSYECYRYYVHGDKALHILLFSTSPMASACMKLNPSEPFPSTPGQTPHYSQVLTKKIAGSKFCCGRSQTSPPAYVARAPKCHSGAVVLILFNEETQRAKCSAFLHTAKISTCVLHSSRTKSGAPVYFQHTECRAALGHIFKRA